MDAIEAIKTRRSIRAYQPRPVPREILADVVDCARLAPCAMNCQRWDFVVITRQETIQSLARIIGHATWLPQAPACIIVLCDPSNAYYVEDGSAATQNILLAARAHGLGSCWIAAEKQDYAGRIRELVGGAAQYQVLSVVSLGYPAEEPTFSKRPLESVLHWERMPASENRRNAH